MRYDLEDTSELALCCWNPLTDGPQDHGRKPPAIEPDFYNDEHVSALERWQDRAFPLR